MDLLKTILIYMSMVFVSSVQTAPETTIAPILPSQSPTAFVQEQATATPTPVPTPTPTPVPTPDITPNNDYKTIRVGDKGDEVKKLQRRLAELGYYEGDIDGVFGNQTRRAVERFQYYHGLSADGIAGKRTLTVLYESKDVVFAPVDVTPTPTSAASVTPAPQRTNQPTVARTVSPDETTPAPTFVPTATPPAQSGSMTEQPTTSADGQQQTAPIQASSAPSQEVSQPATTEPEAGGESEEAQQLPVPMEGYSILIAEQSEPLVATVAEGMEPKVVEPLQIGEETVLIPLLKILESESVVVVPSLSDGHEEYAFAIVKDVYLLTYDIDSDGNVTSLSIYKNGQPQLMSSRVAVLHDGMLYLSLTAIEQVTGITDVLNPETKTYTITLPTGE